MSHTSEVTRKSMANAIRALSMDAVQKANSGHPGLPMGAADFATTLFADILKYDAANPNWFDRDRFVLSGGHGSMLLYSLLHLTGYADMTMEQIKNFRQWGSITAGHPEYGHASGVEMTTGPLGQGLATAVGMAMAERHLNAKFGDDLVNHRTYVLAGDGCLMEGISQEAIGLAGHLALKNLIVLWDDNGITIDGKVSLSDSTDQLARFAASGWDVRRIDGHNHAEVLKALQDTKSATKPCLIACKTIIGFGSPAKQGTQGAHGAPLGPDEIAKTREVLGWPYAPFEIPADIMSAWRNAGARGAADRTAWEKRLAASPHRAELTRLIAGELPSGFDAAIDAYKQTLAANPPALATRASSQNALNVINPVVTETIGGSADLTHSNNTNSKDQKAFTAQDYAGSYVYYGIREHGMAAAINGMALHGGVIPYGGTFMCFTDYCRPSIRLAALMGIRSIFVMTHDSIGLGEDGPTHQPVEHLAALRVIPNLVTMRPCDAIEAAECWQIALSMKKRPSIITLTRQKLKPARLSHVTENLCAKGAYEVASADGKAEVVIFASGSEVEIAMAAKAQLDASGKKTRVVSVPSMELFADQPAAYRKQVLGQEKIRIAIEAGVKQGWESFIGDEGHFIGMTGFGASAPAEILYEKFGITAAAAVKAAEG